MMKRLCIICGGAALVSWTALLLAGRPMADALGQRFGTALLKLGEGKFVDGFMASPAISGKALYLRSKTALYRVEAAP